MASASIPHPPDLPFPPPPRAVFWWPHFVLHLLAMNFWLLTLAVCFTFFAKCHAVGLAAWQRRQFTATIAAAVRRGNGSGHVRQPLALLHLHVPSAKPVLVRPARHLRRCHLALQAHCGHMRRGRRSSIAAVFAALACRGT